MTIPKLLLLLVGGLLILGLTGQTARPNAYSVTEIFYGLGAPATWSIYRDGSEVLVDKQNMPDQARKYHIRMFYDLPTHTQAFWDVDAPAFCNTGPLQDDELESGDPFGTDLAAFRREAKEIGAETIHGVAAKIYQEASPNRTVKMWIDPKSGDALKVEATLDGET